MIKASAFKNFLVFFYVSISFIIFIINGLVNWEYGLVHGIGNIIGAQIAARISLTKSINFVKWLIVAIMILIFIDLTGIISLKQLVLGSLGNV